MSGMGTAISGKVFEATQAVVLAAVEHVLQVYGFDSCSGEWGKPLGDGLYEFRIRKSLRTIPAGAGLDSPENARADRGALLRVFCTFHGHNIVLLFRGYNNKTDSSVEHQQREIAKAEWPSHTRTTLDPSHSRPSPN
jgi:hypothetical protein